MSKSTSNNLKTSSNRSSILENGDQPSYEGEISKISEITEISEISRITEITKVSEISKEEISVKSYLDDLKEKLSQMSKDDVDNEKSDTSVQQEFFIQDFKNKINELQDTYSQHRDQLNLDDLEKPILVHDVRVSPGTMLFKEAYDGKKFNQTLTLTNCGKHPVTIRIFEPTSKSFKIKPVKVGHVLSSGLSISRQISFLYTKPTAIPQACMDIYINNICLRYELLVITCHTHVTVKPKVLDYGEIDVGMLADTVLTISNSGNKQAAYSIDLGRNPLGVIVRPLKGTVQPGEAKKVTIEIFGTNEGEFQQEFWIKTEPLQRVHIQGTFIEPTLLLDYPLGYSNFLILYFSKTFAGVKQQKNVVIRNHSSSPAVFAVMGRTKNEKFPLKEIKDVNYKQFHISPMEGRLLSQQQYIMGISFVPHKPTNLRPDYYICSVIVDVKKCRVGNALQPKKNIFLDQNVIGSPLSDVSVVTLNDENEPEQEIRSLNDMITVLLYGEVETPEITINPSKLFLEHLKVNEYHEEPLRFFNHSKNLPLIIKYNKVACVEIEPKVITLPPDEETAAIIKLRPVKMGETTTRVVFDVLYRQYQEVTKVGTTHLDVCYLGEYTSTTKLLARRKPYFVPGITPLITNEVGYLVGDVRFSSKIEKPRQAIVDKSVLAYDKNKDALIAFPNDRPKCLRPWRNTEPCNTIFARLPRIVTEYDVDYDLTPNEKLMLDTKESYYKNYIRSLASKTQTKELDESFEEYATKNRKLLMTDFKIGDCPPILKHISKQSLFVPLSPYELHNLVVEPKFIQLGMLASHTFCSDKFTVENKNSFPIHVSLKSLYTSIIVPREQFVLAPNSQNNINFTYFSDTSGSHHIPLYIIFNFFNVFDVTILATIVSNTVKCITKTILIIPTEKTAFLQLANPINSDVKFTIDTTYFHLESFPSSGVIPAKKNMTCTITFNPEVGYKPVKEIAVVSESGSKELVEVHFDRKKAIVTFSTENIDFDKVPLDTIVSREITIKNHSDQLVPVNIEIENSHLCPELCITPMQALIWQKGETLVTFSVKFKEVVRFKIPVKIILQYEYPMKVLVSGSVIFPEIDFSPNLIKIPKIPSGAMVKTPFRLYNCTSISNFMSFSLNDYPEFKIKMRTGEYVSDGLSLAPNETKDLYLEFNPQEPVAYCIYLPYVLNDVLGPPELNRPESLKCSEYLHSTKNAYKTATTITSKLNVMKVLCAAGKNWLKFRSLELKFCRFSENMEQNFEVTNISGMVHVIRFKVKTTESFKLTPESYNMTIIDENNFNIILEPDSTFQISVEFCPMTYGTIEEEVLIYVKDYSETVAYNCLKLIGNNPEPQIVPSQKSYYFLPISVGCRLEKSLTLKLTAHQCNGNVDVECDSTHVEVFFVNQDIVSPYEIWLKYKVQFEPKEDCNIEAKIQITCKCPASAEIDVYACGDPSLVINFISEDEYLESSTYPFFPKEDDQSLYGTRMHSIVPILERWIYSQGYLYQNYYRIPNDISRYPSYASEDKNKIVAGKKINPPLPLVQLLINLMDSSILKYIDNGLQPSDEDKKAQTLYNYVTYRNTLSFLKSQGVRVPGLKPEHLMTYGDYVTLKESFVDNERPSFDDNFTEDEFYRFSKQKWLDLIFHIYKVLVLIRVVNPAQGTEPTKECPEGECKYLVQDKYDFYKYCKRNMKRFPNRCPCDAKLLLWLEFHYNRQRTVLWPDEVFEGRQYYNDYSNIDDSLALITVTAAYCPYLNEEFKDTYASPKKVEHRVHNACRVIQVWKSLRLSFEIHPATIVTGNRIKIMFIVTYLYGVLPNFYPTKEIAIEAPLSESSTYELNVSNCGDVPIKYVALFFGDKNELFQLDNNQISIPAKKSRKINLTFFAKKVLPALCILVLSGEVTGQKYAKSLAVTISGIPKSSACIEIKIPVETYQKTKRKLTLQSPYMKTYTAKLYMCFEKPTSYKDLHAISAIKAKSIPREIDVKENECQFIEKTDTVIHLEMWFVSQGVFSFYLYFCDNDVGDFYVLVNIISVPSKNHAMELSIELSDAFEQKCTCTRGFNINCPKTIVVMLPCRNAPMWESITIMTNNCFANSKSVKILEKYFGTPLVFRLLKFYLERFPEGFMLQSCIFNDAADFTITRNKKFSTPKPTFRISDVTAEHTVPFVLHWNDSELPKSEILELVNTNEKETRFYKLIFSQRKKSVGSNGSRNSRLRRRSKSRGSSISEDSRDIRSFTGVREIRDIKSDQNGKTKDSIANKNVKDTVVLQSKLSKNKELNKESKNGKNQNIHASVSDSRGVVASNVGFNNKGSTSKTL